MGEEKASTNYLVLSLQHFNNDESSRTHLVLLKFLSLILLSSKKNLDPSKLYDNYISTVNPVRLALYSLFDSKGKVD